MSDAARFAEPVDVLTCYRLILRREPENAAVLERHLGDRPTIWELIQRFLKSKEYESVAIERASLGIWNRQDGRNIQVDASAEAKSEILAHIEQVWSSYAAEDPYFSVLTSPAYRAVNINDETKKLFFQTGASAVNNLLLAFERNRIEVDPRWRILDLGCGVGRIGEHLCHRFAYYYGVDISNGHLSYAKERFKEIEINNAEFILLTNSLSADISFDIFYSIIVLQHNPPPIIYYLLDRFLEKLNPGGFAFFQLPCQIYGYSFDLDKYFAGEGKRDGMEMHALPQKYVFDVLHKHSLKTIEIWPFPVIGPIGISYAFFAQKTAC